MPTGLRSPEAKTRFLPVARSISSTAARLCLFLDAVLTNIRVRPDADVQPLAVRAGNQALGPVMITPCGKVGDFRQVQLRSSFGLLRRGRPTTCSPRWRRRSLSPNERPSQKASSSWQRNTVLVSASTVAILVAQERNAVGALGLRACTLHEQALDPSSNTFTLCLVVSAGRRTPQPTRRHSGVGRATVDAQVPSAKRFTPKPAAGVGASPAFEPTAFATLTVGMSEVSGAGRVGLAP